MNTHGSACRCGHASQPGEQSIVISGGYFCGTQAVFEHTKGVNQVTSDYARGEADTAHYYMMGVYYRAAAVDLVFIVLK